MAQSIAHWILASLIPLRVDSNLTSNIGYSEQEISFKQRANGPLIAHLIPGPISTEHTKPEKVVKQTLTLISHNLFIK